MKIYGTMTGSSGSSFVLIKHTVAINILVAHNMVVTEAFFLTRPLTNLYSAMGLSRALVNGFFCLAPGVSIMEAFFISAFSVTLAEMGDKTQLLALLLTARFQKPWLILLGIFLATVANHALAGLIGQALPSYITDSVMDWILIVVFIAVGIWLLIPDKLEEENISPGKLGVLGTTIVAFFLAEMGDKTQIATITFAARFPDQLIAVIMGTTVGMMLANAPAVWLGKKYMDRIPLKLVHIVSALIFFGLAVSKLILINVG